ncbi:MAG: RHS repeat-associated core domain-containing protein [Eubacterium sp.]|uniref:RHS repeat protein n=2 Tax=Eubacterium sp. TaxID=142586 RepID=UPI00300E813F
MSAYEYDGLGNRTKETITTGLIKKKKKEKEYVWDYTEKYPVLLEEKESDGTIVRYTYAGNRERAYADVTKNSENAKAQVYSLYTDRQGSTRWALDENAEVAEKTEYDAWGKPETETVSSKLNGINISKSYTGYVYDETTGYWNAGARMYNSTDREFIQKDPKAGNVYETLTQNGYIYCGDNPLYYIDPDGCSYISTLGNAGRTAFNVVKSGVAGGLGFYTRICCEIDNMPTWAKAAVGTTGIVVAGVSGVGAAAIAEAVIASAGISAATDGAFYTVASLRNGSFSRSEFKNAVINGAVNGYMFGGAGVGVAGIRNAAKSGKLAGVMADEAGSVSYEGGTGSVDIELKYKDGWTAAQKAEADVKVKALSDATTIKTPANRGGTSASSRYKSAYGKASVPSGYDVDHTIDLQLGGADDILNMNPLDMSVNRSLGVQIKNAIKDYPDETVFGQFTIQ